MSRRFYAVHRWLGLIVGVQLALWCVGGLIFATHDLAWVRGEDGRNPARAPGLDLARVRLAPDAAAGRLGPARPGTARPGPWLAAQRAWTRSCCGRFSDGRSTRSAMATARC